MQILRSIDHYLATLTGDVKKLKPPRTAFRLRSGDYRVSFDLADDNAIHITGARNRREAYRVNVPSVPGADADSPGD